MDIVHFFTLKNVPTLTVNANICPNSINRSNQLLHQITEIQLSVLKFSVETTIICGFPIQK